MVRSLSLWFAGVALVCCPFTPSAHGCHPMPDVGIEADATSREWTEEQRRADPAGYFVFVRDKLDQEAAALVPACQHLKEDIERQTAEIAAKEELWGKAKDVADTFRAAYQRAKDTDHWPVDVCGALYNEEQLVSQVSMLMEEAKGLAECVTNMKSARDRAEAKLEELNVRRARVAAQSSVCLTLFELWSASQIHSEGRQMLAFLEQLIADQPLDLASCTARTDDGFPALAAELPDPRRDLKPVVEYLQQSGASSDQTMPVQRQETRTSMSKPKSKPIFTQQ
jgi:hypothetical protein